MDKPVGTSMPRISTQWPKAEVFVDGKLAGTLDEESYHFTNDKDVYVPCQLHGIYVH